MTPPPTPSAAPSEESSPSHPEKPPHPVHSIYPIFVPADLSDDFIHAFSGATAGFASGVVTCPLDVIKTKLQAQGGWSLRQGAGPSEVVYNGLVGTANKIWHDEGFKGMYRGLGPLILGYLPTWTVYFTVYEKAKGVLEPGGQILSFSATILCRNFVVKHLEKAKGHLGRFDQSTNHYPNNHRNGKNLGNAYPLRNDCWCLLHNLHQPYLGNQDTPNGTIKALHHPFFPHQDSLSLHRYP